MNFRTFEDLNKAIYKNLHRIPKDIDVVVGIPRSGMMLANLLALYLNMPMADIDTFVSGRFYQTGNTRKSDKWVKNYSDVKKILLVDDSISSGAAMSDALDKIKAEVKYDINIVTLAAYALPINRSKIDIYFEVCNHPRIFEWNYMHHWGLEYCCMDIDGVICEDPSFLENDDGRKYLDFIQNAKPKFIPTQKVKYFVTSRLEKYRKATESWLEKYSIQYDELVMLDMDSKKERLKSNFQHGVFKGNIYKSTDTFLFIESSYEQAIDICKISGKQVFCIETRSLITPQNLYANMKIMAKDWKITAKRVVKKIIAKTTR